MDEPKVDYTHQEKISRSMAILDELVAFHGRDPGERFLNLEPQQETELVERWAERASRSEAGIPNLLYRRGTGDDKRVNAFRSFLGFLREKPALKGIFVADVNRQFREWSGREFDWEHNSAVYIGDIHHQWREEDREDGLIGDE